MSIQPTIDLHAVAAVTLDGLRDGVLVVGDGRVVLANRALCALTGDDRDELIGRPPPAWVPALRHGSAHDAEVSLDHADGRRRRASLTIAPCELPGASPGWIVTVRDRSAQAAREAELVRQAHLDGLTGLLNQRTFAGRLAEEAERLAAVGRPLSLIVVDLDHFKAVNDEHGHPAGDRVLAEAARRIAAEARAIDSVARIGGEEFAWLVPDASPEEALIAAERLRAAIRSRPFATGLPVTASIGVCDLGSAGDPAALMDRADQALYWAKAHGRDAALVWSPQTADRMTRASEPGGSPAQRLAALVRLAAFCEPGPGGGHAGRVAELAVAVAGRLDWSPVRQARLHRAALVHDLGKAAMPDSLLARRGPLTVPEAEHVRRHAVIGASMAGRALDAEQAAWVRHHHERWDGAGYPAALAGTAIPDGAQIVALADAWDAMTTARPYRPALSRSEALEEVDRQAGGHFMAGAGALLRDALRWLAGA
jgi:diguanylate cyclase (GGDEF)-like protein